MRSKKYSLTVTDTVFELLNSLERAGHNVRDVLNAGVVLFDEAGPDDRGRSIMIAYDRLKQEFDSSVNRLYNLLEWTERATENVTFSDEDKEIARKIYGFLHDLHVNASLADDSVQVTKDVLQSRKVHPKKKSPGKTG